MIFSNRLYNKRKLKLQQWLNRKEFLRQETAVDIHNLHIYNNHLHRPYPVKADKKDPEKSEGQSECNLFLPMISHLKILEY